MQPEEVLDLLAKNILKRPLSSSERQILLQSWQGHSYDEIAEKASYTSGYLKVVGARLWRDLSRLLGQKVTKKNVYSLLVHHLRERRMVQQQPQQLTPESELFNLERSLGTRAMPFVSGPLSIDSPFYIERPPTELLASQAIERPGCLLRLKAPRRYGKSSLMLRILARADDLGFKTVILDFKDAERLVLGDLERLLRWFCANIARQLGLASSLNDFWDTNLGSKVSCKAFLQEEILKETMPPVLIALNEVNQVFEHPQVAQDFLPLLRSFHEQARRLVSWQKLRLVMVYSTEIYVPLRLNQSPFNVGMSLCLPPFSPEQVDELADKYNLPPFSSTQMTQLMKLLGGQPYLLNRAFYALKELGLAFERLLETAPTPSGIYGDHLQRYLAMLSDQPDLITALEAIIHHGSQVNLDRVSAYKLSSIGLVKLEGYEVKVSCDLYRLYFEHIFGADVLSA